MKRNSIIILSLCVVIAAVFYIQNNKKIDQKPVGANLDNEIATSTSKLTLIPYSVTLQDGSTFELSIPEDFEITPVAEGLGRARFMAMSPDNRLFVTNMKNLDDNSLGEIYILSDFNNQTKKFTSKTTYLSNLRNPNSLTFYKDQAGTTWLYIALTDKLIRYNYTINETSPTTEPEILATFPDYGLSYKYGGWHLTRTVKIHNDKVYVSVGSSCNSCEEKEDVRASIIEMNPDGTNQKIIAQGLRNAVGLTIKNNELFASNMGSDHLGIDKPEETLYKITSGTHYGWPYCYEFESNVYADTSQNWETPIDCTTVPKAEATFPAHAAPLGVTYFGSTHSSELADSFLVALHGSGIVSQKKGYSIVRVNNKGTVEDFITGFLNGTTRNGRPVDILPYSKGFLFTDDFKGVLYYVYKK